MTKRDYQKAAEIVAKLPLSDQEIVRQAFINLFISDNPKFREDLFLEKIKLETSINERLA